MAEFSNIIPWIVTLVLTLTVFLVMAVIVSRGQTLAADQSKVMLQLLGQRGAPAPLPAVIDVTPVPRPAALPPPAPPSFLTKPALPPAPVAPKPTGAFAAAPPWFQWALHEIGFHETGNNQGIERYIGLAHCGSLGDPWCAIFMNAALEASGIPGTRSASSQSPRTNPGFVQLSGPALGAIVVFWRGSHDSGLGHVGFYRGEDADRVWTLGGNENDMVQIEALPKSGATFGLVGYWWPKSVPLPAIAPVLMPTGSPVHVQTAPPADGVVANSATTAAPGQQTGITATMFGGQQSAYGGAIDDNGFGVALPFHFTGDRPKVRVTGKKTGQSIDCDIVDVGPWNTHDPYWQTGARPQAETGIDMTGRHTNKAGIDLSFAAAKALGIDGKGLCDWSFITSPLAEPSITPKVT